MSTFTTINQIKTPILFSAVFVLLTACGGSSGGGNAGGNNNGETGHVGDGYIQGAIVCHDTDGDLDCSDEVASATTLSDGSFTLANYDPTQTLLAHIPVGAVDTGPFADGSTTDRPFTAETWYHYPAGTSQGGSVFISPLLALAYAQQQATPGLSFDDAVNVVAANLGLTPNQITSDYLAGNDSEAQFIAEIVGAAIANTANTNSSFSNDMQTVLDDMDNISNTAANNDASSYDTTVYTPQATSNNASNLNYIPVADACADLLAGGYFAFESWDGTGDKEHKTLYMQTINGNNILNFKEEVLNGNAWSIEQSITSTEAQYLSNIEGTIIDMANVNGTSPHTQVFFEIPFPATSTSCNGSNASFNSSGREYTMVVSEADISGTNGANLPQGSTVGTIVDPITFGAGDKIYKIAVISQNRVYGVRNKTDVDTDGTVYPPKPEDYIVFDEGTLSGGAFTEMPNSNDINAMAQLTDTDFIVDYRDSSNFKKLSIITPASTTNNTGIVDIVEVDSGTVGLPTTMTYVIETHNGTPFFVVKNYPNMNQEFFIGKITSIDANSFVFGQRSRPAGQLHYLTQGGIQDGDIMDDISLNASARNRVLNGQSVVIPQ